LRRRLGRAPRPRPRRRITTKARGPSLDKIPTKTLEQAGFTFSPEEKLIRQIKEADSKAKELHQEAVRSKPSNIKRGITTKRKEMPEFYSALLEYQKQVRTVAKAYNRIKYTWRDVRKNWPYSQAYPQLTSTGHRFNQLAKEIKEGLGEVSNNQRKLDEAIRHLDLASVSKEEIERYIEQMKTLLDELEKIQAESENPGTSLESLEQLAQQADTKQKEIEQISAKIDEYVKGVRETQEAIESAYLWAKSVRTQLEGRINDTLHGASFEEIIRLIANEDRNVSDKAFQSIAIFAEESANYG